MRAVALLPGIVTAAVPALILWRSEDVSVGWDLPAGLAILPTLAGVALIGIGLLLMVWTIALFVRVGRGTLAPWDPTSTLVAVGPYRHVRNPMISGVLFVLLGEAGLLGSPPLLIWFGSVLTLNALYLPLVEEPGLHRRFGPDYEAYRAAVPRWIPRLSGPASPPPRRDAPAS